MGLIGSIFGAGAAVKDVGQAVTGVAEVFVGNQSERDQAAQAKYVEAITQFGNEFSPAETTFDRIVNGMNRIPRPLMTLGTLGLFVYAMAAPVGFSERMEGLQLVPEPLWWLLGAIVSFYFGARELHYNRVKTALRAPVAIFEAMDRTRHEPEPGAGSAQANDPDGETDPERMKFFPTARKAVGTVKVRASDPTFNAALEEWRAGRS